MAFLSLFFLLITLLLCPPILATNHTDHLALLSIKSSIAHDPQHVLDSWNTSLHFCQWQGVTCGRRHSRVTKLDLGARDIVGSLSPHIRNLSFLRVIILENNTFQGLIPPQIGDLFRLQELFLSNNSFEGVVPASLSNCTRLNQLRLARNKLFGRLPQQLSSLVNLVLIAIRSNGFTGGIPSFLANLTSLESLSAAENHLGGSIPPALGQLPNLQRIGFGENQLYGVIRLSMYNLTSLVIISFTNNQINGEIPNDIGLQLPNLVLFQMGGNRFTGTIPSSLSNCSNMKDLSLEKNLFTGKVNINFRYMSDLTFLRLYKNRLGSSQPGEMSFIDSLANCSKLEKLVVHENQLRGLLPSSIGNLSSQLTFLTFGSNLIHGSLPSGIGNLVMLERLIMDDNQFSGIIPSELGNLQNLKRLNLSYNSFIGNIPDFIGNLSLIELFMRSNRLEGQIPPNLGKSKSLILLDLSKNNLTGPIPLELFQLSTLSTALYLSQNNLVGPLPQEIGKLESLTALDLSQNDLVGEIPDAIGRCIGLEYLSLYANSFQGSIPLSMRDLRGIRILDLSSNNFSGQIPKFLEQQNLSSLNLSFNNFYGEVPTRGIFKNTNSFGIDGNKGLCGGVPVLGLPKCAMLRRSTSHVVLVVILLCSFLVAFVILILCFCSRRRRKQAQPTNASFMQPFSRVSYQSILKATNGFSEQNLIGIGGFSVVYKGFLEPDDTMVAIKVLKLGNQGALKSFMVECEALKNIRHRNLVKVITSCSSIDFQGNDFKALIYEYMPNGNLDRWLHPSPEHVLEIKEAPQSLNLRQRLEILTDVAHAIHYLHQDSEVPIIHCDLKPSNILLDNEMVAHVSDFGMAKLLSLKPVKAVQLECVELLEYSLGNEMTKEGDIYSFGILLLEMMTGKRPTDQIFEEGLNLHGYVKMTFPNRFMTVIDPSLLHVLAKEMEAVDIDNGYSKDTTKKWKRLEECMISLGRIGLACSMESPKDRIDIGKIIHELHHISGIINSVL